MEKAAAFSWRGRELQSDQNSGTGLVPLTDTWGPTSLRAPVPGGQRNGAGGLIAAFKGASSAQP